MDKDSRAVLNTPARRERLSTGTPIVLADRTLVGLNVDTKTQTCVRFEQTIGGPSKFVAFTSDVFTSSREHRVAYVDPCTIDRSQHDEIIHVDSVGGRATCGRYQLQACCTLRATYGSANRISRSIRTSSAMS